MLIRHIGLWLVWLAPACAQQTAATALRLDVRPACAVSLLDWNSQPAGGSSLEGAIRFRYWLRTSLIGGTGSIEMRLDAGNRSPSGVLQFSTKLDGVGRGLTGEQPALLPGATVATFGADTRTSKSGNQGIVNWTMKNGAPILELPKPILAIACR